MNIKAMQIVRLAMMVLAIAGVIYALEYLPHGFAVWFWVALLGVGFVGLLYSFRVTQRRLRAAKPDARPRAKRRPQRPRS